MCGCNNVERGCYSAMSCCAGWFPVWSARVMSACISLYVYVCLCISLFCVASECHLQFHAEHGINTKANADILIQTDQNADVTFQYSEQCAYQHSAEFTGQCTLLRSHINTYMDTHSIQYINATANANKHQTDTPNMSISSRQKWKPWNINQTDRNDVTDSADGIVYAVDKKVADMRHMQNKIR